MCTFLYESISICPLRRYLKTTTTAFVLESFHIVCRWYVCTTTKNYISIIVHRQPIYTIHTKTELAYSKLAYCVCCCGSWMYSLDDELELEQVERNCYSKKRLVNFYSLMNYIHLKNEIGNKAGFIARKWEFCVKIEWISMVWVENICFCVWG